MANWHRRSQPLYILGIITLVAGFCSFCGGAFLEGVKPAKPSTQGQVYCEGISPMIVGRQDYIAPSVQTHCWTPSVNTSDGKGRILTEARNNEAYTGFCANGKQYQGQGVAVWSEKQGCPFPIYFKAASEPFVLYIKQP